jgi:hypothetical protein
MPPIDRPLIIVYLPVLPLDQIRPRIAQTAAIVRMLTSNIDPSNELGTSAYVDLMCTLTANPVDVVTESIPIIERRF